MLGSPGGNPDTSETIRKCDKMPNDDFEDLSITHIGAMLHQLDESEGNVLDDIPDSASTSGESFDAKEDEDKDKDEDEDEEPIAVGDPAVCVRCGIKWSHRDIQLRKSGAGNVHVENLAPTIDNRDLNAMFSIYGTVLSCKVVQDQDGNSKRYGYIHFENVEDAQKAIAALDGKQNGVEGAEGEGAAEKLHVAMFVARSARSTEDNWTNLFVKHFPEFWTEEDLKTNFEPYGKIASLLLKRDAEGKSMKVAFVNFTDHENAKKCIEELNGKKHELPEGAEVKEGEPTELYVAKHQNKTEREHESKIYNDRARQERIAKFQGMNLYVKNIDDQITDEQFKDLFSEYGTITSARIMKDDQTGLSRGFGFLCYTSPEESFRAINALNGKIWAGKLITVTLHQKREQRQRVLHLQHQFGNRGGGHNGGGFMNQGGQMPYGGMPMGGMPYGNPMRGGQGQQYPMGMMGGNRNPIYGPGNGGRPYQGQGTPMNGQFQGLYPGFGGMRMQGMQQQGAHRMGPGAQGQGLQRGPQGQGGQQMRPGMGMQQQGMNRRPGRPGMGPGMAQPQQYRQGAPNAGMKFTPGARNMAGMGMPMMMPMQGQQMVKDQPLNMDQLARSDVKKFMICEKLFPMIERSHPALASEITGMLLEMETPDLLQLLESPEALSEKTAEAIQILAKGFGALEPMQPMQGQPSPNQQMVKGQPLNLDQLARSDALPPEEEPFYCESCENAMSVGRQAGR